MRSPADSGVRFIGSAALCALAALLSCERPARGARLQASWIGSDTARVSAPATVAWCPVSGRLEVTAIRDDMGFGLVLYPVGEVAAGEFPALDAAGDSITRPGVAAAARRFSEKSILAYQSDSGGLALTREGDAFRVTFDFRMRSPDQAETVWVHGGATRLVPGPCPADSVPSAAPVQ
jgi:hypothetical protein